ncbi:MAG: Trk system potassium transporter TrkA [Bacteroidales bacterium]|nr:Trk system potassium transporter TrkA [Bacteroidales bacterium]
MNIIIAGDGEVGFNLAEALVNSNHNIFIIDPHEELLKRIESHADLMTIVGESNSVSVLRKAHVERADLVISVLHDESINVLTAILAKKLGAKKVIARVNTLNHISDDIKKVYEELGIDIFISPEDIAANEIVSLIHQAQVIEKLDYHEGKLTVYSFKIEPEAPLIGKTLNQINDEYPHLEFRVVSMRRGNERIIPSGDTFIQNDDLVYIISKPRFFNELTLLSGKKKIEVNNIMMVGGGRVGKLAALKLESDYNLKVIEIDYNRCEVLTEMFENALVIHGDARDIELLKDEDIRNVDVFIAVTEDTETNILTCLHARKFGVKKTFALVENLNYIEIAQSVGIDTVINKKLIASSYILQYAMGAQVKSLKRLGGIHAEMLELIARPGSLVTKNTIQNIRFPEGTIIGGITRGEEDYIAVGDFQIRENDKVIIFSLPGNLPKLEKLFQKKTYLF